MKLGLITPMTAVLGWMYQELPGGRLEVKSEGKPAVYTWGPLSAPQGDKQTADAQADGWARYHYRGYEGRDQYYTEYHDLVQTMAGLGADPQYGCGRASWENNSDLNSPYGTSMALMLLPFWTDGCIASMEGLFFEASGTTPYHFLTTAAMSEKSSNPVRQLRYVNNDGEIGVRHMQSLGVKYAMVRTDAAKREAAAQPELQLVASSGPWDVYLVGNSAVVEPLDFQPVVVGERSGDRRERNLELGTSWFQNPDDWAAMPADGGPESWQHIDVIVDESRHSVNSNGKQDKVDYVVPAEPIEPIALPAITVSNIDLRGQSLSFDVDQVGVPVLVKVSYFPNWTASGAEGPWRVGPNMMVVVPTAEHVELHFEHDLWDYFTAFLTLVGIGLCVVWRRRGDLEFDSEMPGPLLPPRRTAPAEEIPVLVGAPASELEATAENAGTASVEWSDEVEPESPEGDADPVWEDESDPWVEPPSQGEPPRPG